MLQHWMANPSFLPGFLNAILALDSCNCRCVQRMRERRHSTHVQHAGTIPKKTEGFSEHFYGYGIGAKEISCFWLDKWYWTSSCNLLHGCGTDPCFVSTSLLYFVLCTYLQRVLPKLLIVIELTCICETGHVHWLCLSGLLPKLILSFLLSVQNSSKRSLEIAYRAITVRRVQ